MSRIALIDGDELAYKIATHYQSTTYSIKKDDKFLWKTRSKADAIESIGSREDLEIEKVIEPLELDGFKHRIGKDISRILFSTSSTDYRLFLSGSNNFRNELATLLPYKGNRPSEKPYHLETIREEFRWQGAETIDWLEADDLLSINSFLFPDTVICSSDKDLKTVPSLNYNITTGSIEQVSEDKARYNFYYQLLLGDAVDNIPSPYQLGPVSAKHILENLPGLSDKDYLEKIIPAYRFFLRSKDKDGNYKTKWYNGQEVKDVLFEIGNLLWMRRTSDHSERWNKIYEI